MKGLRVAKRKRKTRAPKEHTQIFHEVLEPVAYFNFTANERSFIDILWRFTWGLKGMKYKVEAGKLMPWVPSLFVYKGGLSKHATSRIKAKLIEDRVINQRAKGKIIGFNKNWNQWKRTPRIPKAEIARRLGVFPKDFTAHLIQDSKEEGNGVDSNGNPGLTQTATVDSNGVDSNGNSGLTETATVDSNGNTDSCLKRQKGLTETAKVVDSNGNTSDPKHCQPSASTAPKDKERKGEIILNVEDRIKKFEVFWKNWLSIQDLPPSHKQSKPEALNAFTLLVNVSKIHPARILEGLKFDMENRFPEIRAEARAQGNSNPGQYLPGAVKWLNGFIANHLGGDSSKGEEPIILEDGPRRYTQSDLDRFETYLDRLIQLRAIDSWELSQQQNLEIQKYQRLVRDSLYLKNRLKEKTNET